jgi:hypothetical protein
LPNLSIISTTTDQLFAKFQSLDKDSRDLIIILALLGENDVPANMLLRACQPKKYFDCTGEIKEAVLSNLVPVLACSDKLPRALQNLEKLGLVVSKPGPLNGKSFAIALYLR